jgi:hypothetical protein
VAPDVGSPGNDAGGAGYCCLEAVVYPGTEIQLAAVMAAGTANVKAAVIESVLAAGSVGAAGCAQCGVPSCAVACVWEVGMEALSTEMMMV